MHVAPGSQPQVFPAGIRCAGRNLPLCGSPAHLRQTVRMREVATIVCDILEALAVECIIIPTTTTLRELLCQLLLPVMGIAKFAGKVSKVGGK